MRCQKQTKKIMEKQKSRAPNFTEQECLLLADLMGETADGFALSRHKLDKHRFTNQITSATKRKMWEEVTLKFNSSSTTPRTVSELSKKWENLVAKHRAIFADYQRHISLTGAAPDSRCKYSLITEAVIGVIGKDSVSVAGSAGQEMDTTLIQLRQSTSQSATTDKDNNSQEAGGISQMTGRSSVTSLYRSVPSSHISQSPGSSSSNYCQCDPEINMLQKRKLRLEIEYFELKIKKLKGEICVENES